MFLPPTDKLFMLSIEDFKPLSNEPIEIAPVAILLDVIEFA